MSLDYHFALERKEGGLWQPCREAGTEAHGPAYRVTFAWQPQSSPAIDVFIRLLGMEQGRPPDSDRSSFFRHYDGFEGDWDYLAEMQIHWASVPDLLLSEWHSLTHLVQCSVEARFAACFGDGQSTFPGEALLAEGMDDFSVQRLSWRLGCLCKRPIDQHYGKAAHHRRSVAPEVKVPVTWKASFEDLLGEQAYEAFQSLGEAAAPETLRVIMYLA